MAFNDPNLPDALQGGPSHAYGEAAPSTQETLLYALGTAVAALRSDAIEARKTSGIEDVWLTCEEHYLGIDDANRHEFAKANWAKPTSMAGGLIRESGPPRGDMKSTAFVRLTSRYVDMGASKVSEITLPIDDKAFSLAPTPVPELIEIAADTSPLTQDGQQVFRPLNQGETPPQNPAAHGMVPATQADKAKGIMQKAATAATKAETRIYDWMLEANYPAEMRKVVHDAARLGVGVLKAPFPSFKTSFARVNGKLQQKSRLAPGLRQISPWNVYPHGACGDDIHAGDYIFECDTIAPAKLRALKREKLANGDPIYIHSQIDKVLREGPQRASQPIGNPSLAREAVKKNLPFTIWYFTGVISRADMVVMGGHGLDELPDDLMDINAIVTMVNDCPIRAVVNPLESGRFGYRALSWSRRDGSWAGVGPGEQVMMPQRLVNAATRAMSNNAGKSAGAQLVIDRSQIVPASGNSVADWVITPDKIWYMKDDASSDDVRKIFMSVEFPNMGTQLMAIIDYAFRLAEEATNIPLVTQGKESENSPETFGAAQLQNSNAHSLLRSIAYVLDDSITEPVVTDLYEWLLLDDTVPDEEKGDFVINAKGSIAMVEKAIQQVVIAQLLPLSKDPAYGLNPKRTAEQYLQGNRLVVGKFAYTDQELAEIASKPPPEDPRIAAARINAEATVKAAAGHDQATVAKSQADTDRDTVYTQAETERTKALADGAQRKLEMQWQIAMLGYAERKGVTLDQVKKDLAINAQKLNVQRELSQAALDAEMLLHGRDTAKELHMHHNPSPAPPVASPPTEPAGRAPAGQAFAQ